MKHQHMNAVCFEVCFESVLVVPPLESRFSVVRVTPTFLFASSGEFEHFEVKSLFFMFVFIFFSFLTFISFCL